MFACVYVYILCCFSYVLDNVCMYYTCLDVFFHSRGVFFPQTLVSDGIPDSTDTRFHHCYHQLSMYEGPFCAMVRKMAAIPF